jgi:hypothetical protein
VLHSRRSGSHTSHTMSFITPSSMRSMSSSLPVYMTAIRSGSSLCARRQLHTPPIYPIGQLSLQSITASPRHPAQRYPRLRQLSTQTTSHASRMVADEVPVVLPTGQNAKGKAKAVDGLSGDIIGHDVSTSSAAASTKVVPPRRRSIGLKAKKAAITLVSSYAISAYRIQRS